MREEITRRKEKRKEKKEKKVKEGEYSPEKSLSATTFQPVLFSPPGRRLVREGKRRRGKGKREFFFENGNRIITNRFDSLGRGGRGGEEGKKREREGRKVLAQCFFC